MFDDVFFRRVAAKCGRGDPMRSRSPTLYPIQFFEIEWLQKAYWCRTARILSVGPRRRCRDDRGPSLAALLHDAFVPVRCSNISCEKMRQVEVFVGANL